MSFAMPCPNCEKVLDLDDEAKTWRVSCPRCGTKFIANETDRSPEEIEELRRQESDESRHGMKRPRSETAREEVAGPATAMMVLGWLSVVPGILLIAIAVLFAVLFADNAAFHKAEKTTREEILLVAGLQLFQGLGGVVTGTVMLIGSRKMTRFEGLGWIRVAAVLGMLPLVSGCCFLGIPFGIWTLNILNQPHIRERFGQCNSAK